VVWRPEDGSTRRLVGHSALVSAVEFSPAKDVLLASASADGALSLWDVETVRRLLTLEGFNGWEAISMSFSPDGGLIASGGANGEVGVWDLAYFDRHIAGNARRMIERLKPEMGDAALDASMLEWAESALERPWPRLRNWGGFTP
jgi:WD40 repeat protein